MRNTPVSAGTQSDKRDGFSKAYEYTGAVMTKYFKKTLVAAAVAGAVAAAIPGTASAYVYGLSSLDITNFSITGLPSTSVTTYTFTETNTATLNFLQLAARF